MKLYENSAQLPLPIVDQVKEERKKSRKKVAIVSVILPREANLMYQKCKITSIDDAHHLSRQFLQEVNREYSVVLYLDIKSHPHRRSDLLYKRLERFSRFVRNKRWVAKNMG